MEKLLRLTVVISVLVGAGMRICLAQDFQEPTIRQVQEAAIQYAELNPEKIAQWRKKASRRAFFPKMVVSFDKDMNTTLSSNIWGTYTNGTLPGRYYIGPEDQTRYRNNNYSISLTWELGDLIWNYDQTSIDTRSRLMVQLRNDIMDEVARIYFERRRIKGELANLTAEDTKRVEKQNRLDELTARLDGFTGGFFSRVIKSEQGPENKYHLIHKSGCPLSYK